MYSQYHELLGDSTEIQFAHKRSGDPPHASDWWWPHPQLRSHTVGSSIWFSRAPGPNAGA